MAHGPLHGRDHPALHLGRRRHPHVRVQPARRGRAHGLPHHFISRHHVPDERAAVVRGAGVHPDRRPVVRCVLPAHLRPLQAADEAESDLTTCAQENLTGVRVVRAFGRERFETDRFCEKNEKFASLWIRLGRLLSVYWPPARC